MANYCYNILRVKPINSKKESIEQLAKFISDVYDVGTRIEKDDINKFKEQKMLEDMDLYRDDIEKYVEHSEMSPEDFIEYVHMGRLIKRNGEEFYSVNGSFFRMSKILPTPEELLKYSSPPRPENGETQEQFEKRIKSFQKKYNTITSVDWNLVNWGTKWDCMDSDIIKETPKYIKYWYTTAWSPNEAFILTIATKYPLLDFELRYKEEGEGFKGTLRVVNEEVLTDITKDC